MFCTRLVPALKGKSAGLDLRFFYMIHRVGWSHTHHTNRCVCTYIYINDLYIHTHTYACIMNIYKCIHTGVGVATGASSPTAIESSSLLTWDATGSGPGPAVVVCAVGWHHTSSPRTWDATRSGRARVVVACVLGWDHTSSLRTWDATGSGWAPVIVTFVLGWEPTSPLCTWDAAEFERGAVVFACVVVWDNTSSLVTSDTNGSGRGPVIFACVVGWGHTLKVKRGSKSMQYLDYNSNMVHDWSRGITLHPHPPPHPTHTHTHTQLHGALVRMGWAILVCVRVSTLKEIWDVIQSIKQHTSGDIQVHSRWYTYIPIFLYISIYVRSRRIVASKYMHMCIYIYIYMYTYI